MRTLSVSYLLSKEDKVQAVAYKLGQLISRGRYLQQNGEEYKRAIQYGGHRADNALYELTGKCHDYNELIENIARNARAAVCEIDAFVEFAQRHKLTMLRDELEHVQELLKRYTQMQNSFKEFAHRFKMRPESIPRQMGEFETLIATINRHSTELQELITYQAPSSFACAFI